MFSKLQKDNKGFTIIEVLIVLAIAGLIMLIVFLAVPALQRNQRNNARNSDASRVVAAITECLANRNGLTASCDTWAEFAPGTTSQITALGGPSLVAGVLTFANSCSADGVSAVAGAGARSFAFVYQLESGGANIGRCLAG